MEGRGTEASALDECFALHLLAVAKTARQALQLGRVEPACWRGCTPTTTRVGPRPVRGTRARIFRGYAVAWQRCTSASAWRGDHRSGCVRDEGHTYLVARGSVVDVTADQFDGPEVYVGRSYRLGVAPDPLDRRVG